MRAHALAPSHEVPCAPTRCPGQGQEGRQCSHQMTATIWFLLKTTFKKNNHSTATRVFDFSAGRRKLSKCFIQQKREHCYYKLSSPNKFPELMLPESLLSRAVLPSLIDSWDPAGKSATLAPAGSRSSRGGAGGAVDHSPSQNGSEKIHKLCGILRRKTAYSYLPGFSSGADQSLRKALGCPYLHCHLRSLDKASPPKSSPSAQGPPRSAGGKYQPILQGWWTGENVLPQILEVSGWYHK